MSPVSPVFLTLKCYHTKLGSVLRRGIRSHYAHQITTPRLALTKLTKDSIHIKLLRLTRNWRHQQKSMKTYFAQFWPTYHSTTDWLAFLVLGCDKVYLKRVQIITSVCQLLWQRFYLPSKVVPAYPQSSQYTEIKKKITKLNFFVYLCYILYMEPVKPIIWSAV